MSLLNVPACPDIEITTCLGGFFAGLSDETKATLSGAMDAVEEQIIEVSSALGRAAAGASGAIRALQAKLDFLNEEIAGIEASITAIEAYLATVPCSDLLPLKALLEAAKDVLEAQRTAINLNGIAKALEDSLSGRDLIGGHESCLNAYRGAIG